MKAWLSCGPGRLRRGLQRLFLLGCLMAAQQAGAARLAVVLSDDSAPYQEFFQVVHAHLDGSGHEVSRIYTADLTAASVKDARVTVAVGVRAAKSVAALPVSTPVLAVLVPREWYLKGGRAQLEGAGRSVSAIYVDQPFERLARLIRLAFPEAKRVGVLLGAEQGALVKELEAELRAQRLGLVRGTPEAGDRLITPLEDVLAESDLLLALPDPLVFNRNTAQSLFLTTYRHRVPVLGYSRSMTRAGALVSLHTSPAEAGRQAAEWLGTALQETTPRLPPADFPAYFSVSANEQVGRSLGFTLQPEAELEKRLGGGR